MGDLGGVPTFTGAETVVVVDADRRRTSIYPATSTKLAKAPCSQRETAAAYSGDPNTTTPRASAASPLFLFTSSQMHTYRRAHAHTHVRWLQQSSTPHGTITSSRRQITADGYSNQREVNALVAALPLEYFATSPYAGPAAVPMTLRASGARRQGFVYVPGK